jgi:hypothetical protein
MFLCWGLVLVSLYTLYNRLRGCQIAEKSPHFGLVVEREW